VKVERFKPVARAINAFCMGLVKRYGGAAVDARLDGILDRTEEFEAMCARHDQLVN
jgi:hypothetical protein